MATPSSRLFFGLIPWYGLLIALGAALAILLAEKESHRQGLPKDTILDLALWLLPLGIFGARIYYVLFSWPSFRKDPLSVLYIWEGGLAIYGGLIAGCLVLIIFCGRRKLPLFQLLDIIVPGVSLAQAVGRWGNYFNQEAYGLLLSPQSRLAFFPVSVLIQEGTEPGWHLATFFYESVWDFLIFLFLLYGRRHVFRKRGDVFLFYLILYSAGRLVIESLRTDALMIGDSIRVSQLLSILILISIVSVFWKRSRERSFSAFLRQAVFLFSLLLTAFVLALCFTGVFPDWNSYGARTAILSAYSLIMILSSLQLYGRSAASEVCYAHHAV